jgi:surfeit locus 1 family protein
MRRLVLPALFTIAMAVFLCGLGVWQLERLAWKEAILTRIATRTKQELQPLPAEAVWAGLQPDDYDYRHVVLDGTFENDREVLVFHAPPSGRLVGVGPGYLVLTPLRLASGAHVIVNRGFVPLAFESRESRHTGEIDGPTRIVGLMRPPEARNAFTPADTPDKRRYFTRDPASIAQSLGLSGPAPFTIDADDVPLPGGWPRGGTTEVAIPNNHLSYAFTWFGLAIGLLGVFAAYAWRTFSGPIETVSEPAALRREAPADID